MRETREGQGDKRYCGTIVRHMGFIFCIKKTIGDLSRENGSSGLLFIRLFRLLCG